jgi:hypothetical protein
MVMLSAGLTGALRYALLAAEQPDTPLRRLDPATRAKVLAAFAGLVILGFGMVALIWLGARVTRRYMNQGRSDRPPLDENDWARKPLVPPDPPTRRTAEPDQ